VPRSAPPRLPRNLGWRPLREVRQKPPRSRLKKPQRFLRSRDAAGVRSELSLSTALKRNRPSITLTGLFDSLNARFFDGRVTQHTIRRVGRIPAKGADVLGHVHAGTIYVRRSLGPRQLRRTLLHEMIHAITGDTAHGPVFRAELRRLGGVGEAWAAEEALLYRSEAMQPRSRFARPRLRSRGFSRETGR
jgi:hypothetical protein